MTGRRSITALTASAAAAIGGWAGLLVAQQQQQQQRPAPTTRPAAPGKQGKKAAPAAKGQPSAAVEPSAAGPSLGLQFGPARAFRPAAATSFTLANGLRVIASENREIPQVSLSLFVRAGRAADPDGKVGLAELTARSIRTGGGGSLNPSGVEDLLGRAGATLEASTNETRALFGLRVPTPRHEAVAAALRDLVVSPAFDSDSVDLAQGQLMDEIGLRGVVIGSLLDQVFRSRLHDPKSPAARIPTYDSVENTGRGDVVAFHREHYTPNRSLLAIEGDLSQAEAKTLAEKLFGSWKPATGSSGNGPATPAESAKPGQRGTGVILFADRADWRYSGIVLGHTAGALTDADFPAMQVICEMLAVGPNSRLARRAREAGGWNAEWSAVWEGGYERAGEFVVRGTMEGPYTTQAIQIVKNEIEQLRNGQVTDQEVDAARMRTMTRVALRAQSSADQLFEQAAAEFHGVPGDLLAKTYQSLSTLTRADVVRAAARSLSADQVIVVVGNAALFDKPLSTISAKVELIDLTAPAARPMRSKTDAESIAKGREFLLRWQTAMGGREKLAAVKDFSVSSEGTLLLDNALQPAKVRDRWLLGDVYRQDQIFGNVSRSVFYNGKIGWIGMPGLVAPLNEGLLLQVRGELFRLPFRIALSDSNEARQVTYLGGSTVQIAEGDSLGMRAYLDPKTDLPQRVVYRVMLGGGASVAVEESYLDWKDFGGSGILWPSRIVVKRNGRKTDELTVTDVKFNSGLSLAEMEKKP